MPLSVLQVTLKSTEDRVSTTGFLWETMLLKCMIHRNLPCIPITDNHHLSLLSSPACSLLSCPLSPLLTLFQPVVMRRAFGGIVSFSFSAGAVLSLLPKRVFPLALTCCVCCKVSHRSQASALSLSCLSVLAVVCIPAISSAFVHIVEHGGEKFSLRSTVLFQVTLLHLFGYNAYSKPTHQNQKGRDSSIAGQFLD